MEVVGEVLADGDLYYFNLDEGAPGDGNGGLFFNTDGAAGLERKTGVVRSSTS
jgi:hypothetical protein